MNERIRINPQKMEGYRRTARARLKANRENVAVHHQRAWETARRAAALLKSKYTVEKVVVFGSLVQKQRFHASSDIDLAVWGFPDKGFYRAVANLLDLDPEIQVDLVEFEHARPGLQAVILQEGVEL